MTDIFASCGIENFSFAITLTIIAILFALGLWTQSILFAGETQLSWAQTVAFTLLGVFALGMTLVPVTHVGLWNPPRHTGIEVWFSALAAPFMAGFGAKAQLTVMHGMPRNAQDSTPLD